MICHHWDCLQVLYIQYTYTFFQIIHQNLLKPKNNAPSVRDMDIQLTSVSRSNIMNVLILAPTSIVFRVVIQISVPTDNIDELRVMENDTISENT